MNRKTVKAEPVATEGADVIPEPPLASSVAPPLLGVFTRDIDALCRALDAQQQAHFQRTDAAKK